MVSRKYWKRKDENREVPLKCWLSGGLYGVTLATAALSIVSNEDQSGIWKKDVVVEVD